jgi:hypothetical protein
MAEDLCYAVILPAIHSQRITDTTYSLEGRMDREDDISQERHFHIHWTKNDRLNWEAFDSHNEVLSRALEVAQAGEMFAIEEASVPRRLCGGKVASAS